MRRAGESMDRNRFSIVKPKLNRGAKLPSRGVELGDLDFAATHLRKPRLLCVSPPICQALPGDSLERGISALCVIHAKRRAVVVSEIEFRNVPLQMLFTNMVIRPNQTTLEQREKAFNGVRVDRAAHVFTFAMPDRLMGCVDRPDDAVLPRFVCHQVRVRRHLGFQNRLKGLGRHVRHVEGAHFAAALDKREHRVLMSETNMRSSCLLDMPFLDAQSRCVASTHLWRGILESSNTVPTVTVNWLRQSPQKIRPGRWDSPSRRLLRSVPPQWGQTGPVGQRMPSRCLRAASSLVNRASVWAALLMANLQLISHFRPIFCVCQVHTSPN